MYYGDMAKQRSIVADRIEDLLRIKGMSVADLSRASGVSEGSISNILSGNRQNPRSDTVEKIARGFPTSSDYLSGRSGNPEPSDAPPLPDFAAEVVEFMRQLDRGRNYELYIVAKGFVESSEEIRRMARQELIEMMLDYGDEIAGPEQTDLVMETLRRLDQRVYGNSDQPPKSAPQLPAA